LIYDIDIPKILLRFALSRSYAFEDVLD